jgi:hypothetical protein
MKDFPHFKFLIALRCPFGGKRAFVFIPAT